MPLNTKTIKRRIKSIGSTKKITRAMEMISAVKMRKAVAAVLASRAYAKLAWEVLSDIASKTDIKHHPLLARREVKKIGLIFITSNRGLAGGFTSRLLAEAHNYIMSVGSALASPPGQEPVPRPPREGVRTCPELVSGGGYGETEEERASVGIILMGRRGQRLYTRFGHSIAAEFEKIDLTASVAEVLPLTQMIINDYSAGKYDKVALAYTDYVSAVKQVPRVKQLLPITNVMASPSALLRVNSAKRSEESPIAVKPRSLAPQDAGLGMTEYAHGGPYGYGFKYEPNAKQVLDNLLPRLIEMQIYQTVLESDASEHSARMLAMKNASEAAEDITRELQFNYNKARQAAITQEISEIVGGAAALE